MTKRAEKPALSRVSKIKGDIGFMESAFLPGWVVEVDETPHTDWMTADVLLGKVWDVDTSEGVGGYDPETGEWALLEYSGTVTIGYPGEA